jgi:hypothetical protein
MMSQAVQSSHVNIFLSRKESRLEEVKEIDNPCGQRCVISHGVGCQLLTTDSWIQSQDSQGRSRGEQSGNE